MCSVLLLNGTLSALGQTGRGLGFCLLKLLLYAYTLEDEAQHTIWRLTRTETPVLACGFAF